MAIMCVSVQIIFIFKEYLFPHLMFPYPSFLHGSRALNLVYLSHTNVSTNIQISLSYKPYKAKCLMVFQAFEVLVVFIVIVSQSSFVGTLRFPVQWSFTRIIQHRQIVVHETWYIHICAGTHTRTHITITALPPSSVADITAYVAGCVMLKHFIRITWCGP